MAARKNGAKASNGNSRSEHGRGPTAPPATVIFAGEREKWVPTFGGATWNKEEPMTGVYQARREVKTRRGDIAGVLTFMTDDGELIDVWQSAYLRDLHDALSPGDIVTIKAAGMKERMRLYDVEIERA